MTYDEHKAFALLSQQPAWKNVIEPLLRSRLKGYDRSNRMGDGVKGNWIQGRSQELDDLLKMFDNARDEMERLDERAKGPDPGKRF